MNLHHLPLRRGEAIVDAREVAEDLDKARRHTWQQRLAEAEAFESAVNTAAGVIP